MAGECNHELIMTETGTRITALGLTNAGAAVKVAQRFSFTPDWARALEVPCIAYGPSGIFGPLPQAATNLRKGTNYPVTIRVLARADKETPELGNMYLRWVDAIRTAFEDKPIGPLVAQFSCSFQGGPLLESDAATLNILSLALFFLVGLREPR